MFLIQNSGARPNTGIFTVLGAFVASVDFRRGCAGGAPRLMLLGRPRWCQLRAESHTKHLLAMTSMPRYTAGFTAAPRGPPRRRAHIDGRGADRAGALLPLHPKLEQSRLTVTPTYNMLIVVLEFSVMVYLGGIKPPSSAASSQAVWLRLHNAGCLHEVAELYSVGSGGRLKRNGQNEGERESFALLLQSLVEPTRLDMIARRIAQHGPQLMRERTGTGSHVSARLSHPVLRRVLNEHTRPSLHYIIGVLELEASYSG